MKKAALILSSLFIILISCKKESNTDSSDLLEIKADSVEGSSIGDNSSNALDWDGVYVGVTPCANCEGISIELTLEKNKTFVLKTKYLGKGAEDVLVEKGSFVWDKTGSIIELQGIEHKPKFYKVGENHLIQMDNEQKIIEGSLATKYILKKQ